MKNEEEEALVGDDSLYQAVVENKASLLNELLENGGNVDAFYEDTMNISSKSLLHVCCGKAFTECLHVMIQHGAQLDVRDKWGQTPLMHSVTIQLPEIAKILLDADPNLVNCQDKFGKSPLHSAVDVGNLELTEMILLSGADVNMRNHDGFSPLMMCCKYADGPHLTIMKYLLKSGALVELKDYKGRQTALHLSVLSRNIEAMELLIAAGIDVNEIDKTLRNPLTHAIFMTRNTEEFIIENMLSLLVSAGANLNVTVTETCNPLLVCAQVKAAKLMKFFLTSGANPNVKFASGLTPALVSASANDLQCLKVLIGHNCDLTVQGSVYKRRRKEEYHLDPFQMALMEGHLDACLLMALSGYPLHARRHMDVFQTCLALTFPDFIASESGSDAVNPEDLIVPLPEASSVVKLRWLLAMSRQCQALKNLCIFAVRSCLKQNLADGVCKLPLPTSVRDAIELKEILSDGLNTL